MTLVHIVQWGNPRRFKGFYSRGSRQKGIAGKGSLGLMRPFSKPTCRLGDVEIDVTLAS